MNITEKTPDQLAKTIEKQTAKLPSDSFLWLALCSIVASLTLKISGRQKDALFVGQWAPTFLVLGVYNKLVKQLGSDRADARSARFARPMPLGLFPFALLFCVSIETNRAC
jgi:hypothetical protein